MSDPDINRLICNIRECLIPKIMYELESGPSKMKGWSETQLGNMTHIPINATSIKIIQHLLSLNNYYSLVGELEGPGSDSVCCLFAFHNGDIIRINPQPK